MTGCRSCAGIALIVASLALSSLVWWSMRPDGTGDDGALGAAAREAVPGDAYRDRVAGLLRSRRLEEARGAVEEWRRACPGDERVALAEAEVAARVGRTGTAIDLLTRHASSSSDPARVWLRLAELYEAQGTEARAIESVRKAIEARPDWLDPRIRLADLLRITGRLEEAAAILEPLLARNDSSVSVRHALAAVRNAEGRFEDVVRLIEPLVDDPTLPVNAREHYAVALGELGRARDAARVWTGILEADPFSREGHYRLGRLARRLRRPQLARALLESHARLEAYRKKLEAARKSELSGRPVNAALERAGAYAMTLQTGRAVEHYRLALAAAGPAPRALVDAALEAISFFLQSDLLPEAEEAIGALRSAGGAALPVAAAMAGLVTERRGETAKAVAAYQDALARRSDYRPALLALARLRLDENHPTAAAPLARRAHAEEVDAESLILLGRVAGSGGTMATLSAEIELFEKAIEASRRRTQRSEARVHLGKALVARSRFEDAARSLESAVSESPWFAEAWRTLARCYRRLEKPDRAREADERAARAQRLEDAMRAERRSLRPGDSAERAAVYLRLSSIARAREERAQNLRYLAAAVYADPRSVEAHRQLAAAYGEPREVFFRLHAFQQVVVLAPDDENARRTLDEERRPVSDW